MGFDALDAAVIVTLFVGVSVMQGNISSYSQSIFVWGPAAFFTLPFMFFEALAGLPFAIFIVPLGLAAIVLYFNKLGETMSEGTVFWIAFGAVVVLLGI